MEGKMNNNERPSPGFLQNLLDDPSKCTLPHPILVQLLLNEIRALQKELSEKGTSHYEYVSGHEMGQA